MSSRLTATNAHSPSADIKAIITETKRSIELWKTMNNTRMPAHLKGLYQRMIQLMADSLLESSKAVNQREHWIQNGLRMWKQSETETFKENYVRKGREEADAVIAALRETRKVIEQIRSYLDKEGKSGRSTTMTPEFLEITHCPPERMNFSSLIKLWSYVRDEILFCIETNLDHISPAISFHREQVEGLWATLGQIYANYATEYTIQFRDMGLDHDIELARKRPSSGWGKICSFKSRSQ